MTHEGKTGVASEQSTIDFADLSLEKRAELATVSVSGVGAAALKGEIGIYTEGTDSDVHAVPGDVTASDPSWNSRGMGNIYHPDKPQRWTQPELDIFGTDASAEKQDGQISDGTPSIDPKTWDYRYPEAGPEDGELLRGDDE